MSTAPEYFDTGNACELVASELRKVESAGPGLVRLSFAVEKRAGQRRVAEPVVHVVLPECVMAAVRAKLAVGAIVREALEDGQEATAH